MQYIASWRGLSPYKVHWGRRVSHLPRLLDFNHILLIQSKAKLNNCEFIFTFDSHNYNHIPFNWPTFIFEKEIKNFKGLLFNYTNTLYIVFWIRTRNQIPLFKLIPNSDTTHGFCIRSEPKSKLTV